MAGTLIKGDSFSETLVLSEIPKNLDFVRISLTQCDKLVGEFWFEPEDISDKGEVVIEIPADISIALSPDEHLIFSASYKLKDKTVLSSCINTSVLVRSRLNLKPMERP